MRAWIAAAFAALSVARAQAPQIFAPGVVSGVPNTGAPTFTPDGATMYFARGRAIMESHRVGGHWSTPAVAPFSGQWTDAQPALAPDGSFLVYVSYREKIANLYRVNRQGAGWSAPERLSDAVNIGQRLWRPSVAGDGTIYFFLMNTTDQGLTMRLYRSAYDHGAYQPAMPLPFSDGTTRDVDPEIAPDQSFIIFASSGRAATDSLEHLFVAVKHGGEWGPVTRLHYAGDDATGVEDNEPRLSHDGKVLYFTSSRGGNTNVVSMPRA
jgi:WD40-like Beta Propeller Repeat